MKKIILVGQMGERLGKETTVRNELHFLKEAGDVLEKGMTKAKAHLRFSDSARSTNRLPFL